MTLDVRPQAKGTIIDNVVNDAEVIEPERKARKLVPKRLGPVPNPRPLPCPAQSWARDRFVVEEGAEREGFEPSIRLPVRQISRTVSGDTGERSDPLNFRTLRDFQPNSSMSQAVSSGQ